MRVDVHLVQRHVAAVCPRAKGSAAYAAPDAAPATATATATTARQQQPALACVFILVGNQENVS